RGLFSLRNFASPPLWKRHPQRISLDSRHSSLVSLRNRRVSLRNKGLSRHHEPARPSQQTPPSPRLVTPQDEEDLRWYLAVQSFVRAQPNTSLAPHLPAKKKGKIRSLLVICRPPSGVCAQGRTLGEARTVE